MVGNQIEIIWTKIVIQIKDVFWQKNLIYTERHFKKIWKGAEKITFLITNRKGNILSCLLIIFLPSKQNFMNYVRNVNTSYTVWLRQRSDLYVWCNSIILSSSSFVWPWAIFISLAYSLPCTSGSYSPSSDCRAYEPSRASVTKEQGSRPCRMSFRSWRHR